MFVYNSLISLCSQRTFYLVIRSYAEIHTLYIDCISINCNQNYVNIILSI